MHITRLQELREKQGLSRLQLAYKVDVDPSTVWRWENRGAIPDPMKHELAGLFGVPIAYLMGWDEAKPRKRVAA